MTFQVLVTGVEELADQQMMTEVQIDRRLYDHSQAHVVIRWQETEGFQDRPAALLAAKVLNCPVEIIWRDNDLVETTPCFRGYIQHADAQRLPTSSVLTLSCVSYSKRADLVPRFRAFQATTLHDIAQQISRTEPLIKIINAADLRVPIALSLQHGETDFAYLSRMLHAWGVPMAADDQSGKVLLGARGREPAAPFPDVDWGWSHITFSVALQALPTLVKGGAGATGLAREALGGFLGQLTRRAADYHPTPEHPQLSQTHAGTASQTDTSGYRMHLDGSVLPHAPGDVVEVEGQQHLIHAVSITGHPQQTTASQQFQLQPLTLPLAPARKLPQWPSRTLWAYVTDNEKDPQQQGRIQVEFEPEPLDPQPSSQRAWLHTLTPYGGGMGPGNARLLPNTHSPRAHAYAAGFYSLPEVGERVLVEFLGQWDSEALVIGAVRHGGVAPADSARDTKRWRTPSGNEVALTTEGEGTAAKDVVSVHARDHVVLQGVVDAGGESVSVQCGGSYVHLRNRGGAMRVEVVSGGSLLVHAAGHLQIEGDSVQIKARGGAVQVSDRARPGGKSANKAPSTKKKAKASATPAARPAQAGRYSSVTATRKGGPYRFAAYKDANGKVQEVRTGGTASWRYNNPGNMNPGRVATSRGAIGVAWVEKDHHANEAVFPDEASGFDGAVTLLKTDSYQKLDMAHAVNRWIGGQLKGESDEHYHKKLQDYIDTVQNHSGAQPTDQISGMNDDQLNKMLRAMKVAEGPGIGTTYTPENVSTAPQWVKDLFEKGEAP